MSSTKQAQERRDLKHRVLTCLHKLSDRDTQSAAASELESIAKTLSSDALPPFISSISATDSSDKSPVRRHCIRLISVISEHHGNSLSPYLSKILSSVARRLRDPDSSISAACVAASFSLASHLTSPPFSSISKPFVECLFTEQDTNAQNGAALCLAAVIQGSRNPDVISLRKMLPKLQKLVKSGSFKANAAVLALIGSVVVVKGVFGEDDDKNNLIKNLVMCLVGLLNSEDWATRKAAAEVLIKIVEVEKDALSEYKASCLKTFEAKRFDKVKAVRETMNQLIEAWKEIPDLPGVVSQPPESYASSKVNVSDGRYPPGSKTSLSSIAPQIKNRKRGHLIRNENEKGTAMFRKLGLKEPSDPKVKIATANAGSSGTAVSEKDPSGGVLKNREEEWVQFAKPEIRRALFHENYENPSIGVSKRSSRVVPCCDDNVISNGSGDIGKNLQDCEDLYLIQKQLVQIENQQSNLLDLLQRFIGSSQNSMHSLESRVHGLELALDEISFDLAISTGKISEKHGTTCCKLPGTSFLSSKIWRKTQCRSSTSLLPASYKTPLVDAARNKNRSGTGIIKNPLTQLA